MSYLTISDSLVAAYAPVTSRLVTRLRDNQAVNAAQQFALTTESRYVASVALWGGGQSMHLFVPGNCIGTGGTRVYVPAEVYIQLKPSQSDGEMLARLLDVNSSATSNHLTASQASPGDTVSASGYFTLDITSSISSGVREIVLQGNVSKTGVGTLSASDSVVPAHKFECLIHSLPAEGY